MDIKTYTALLNQKGIKIPLETILGINTIGDIKYSRLSNGTFIGTCKNAFPKGKTFFSSSNCIRLDDSSFKIDHLDDGLNDFCLEIRVFENQQKVVAKKNK